MTDTSKKPLGMIKAKLRDLSCRGDIVATRWGDVTFDKDGLAELDVPEEELSMLRDMKWLWEPPVIEEPVPEPAAKLDDDSHSSKGKKK